MSPDLACYGIPTAPPHRDRLAVEGARHTNAFVTCSVRFPNRSAIITGTYQVSFNAHNHRSNQDKSLRKDMQLITDCFHSAGYFTSNSPGPAYDQPSKTDFNFATETRSMGSIGANELTDNLFMPRSIFPSHTMILYQPQIDQLTQKMPKSPPITPTHPIKDWTMYFTI